MKHNEPVKKIMSTDLVTVHVKQKVSEVHALLAEHRLHHVPVVSGTRMIGLISATDLLRVSYGDVYRQDPRQVDALLDTMSIRDVMQEDIRTIEPGQSVRRAAEILAQGGYHCLPVVADDELVGMLTTTDLIGYLLDQY